MLFLKALLSGGKLSFLNFASQRNMAVKSCSSVRFCVLANSGAPNRPGSDTQRTYQVVVAATRDMGIGKDSELPWRLPSDLKFFKELTIATTDPVKKNAVLMGRITWESIPPEYRPLPGRLNVVLTRSRGLNLETEKNVVLCQSLPSALQLLAEAPYCLSIEKVFVIGGGQLLREALNSPKCDAIHITEIETSMECDTFIPSIDRSLFQLWYSSPPVMENNIQFSFATYIRVRNSLIRADAGNGEQTFNGSLGAGKFEVENFMLLPSMILERHDEYQYLKLVQEIISSDTKKDDGIGSCTLSNTGCQMRFNLRKSFPLITTKKIFWQGIVEELLQLISGSTSAKVLEEKGIHVCHGNASGDYLDSTDLAEREEGDLGPIDRSQWRHTGARSTNIHADYTSQVFDQLSDVIEKIKRKLDTRWIVLAAQNPSDPRFMTLPPCHLFAQFYIASGELSCQMYQHSADMDAGVPYNIASYALLTCVIAHVCGIVPGDLTYLIRDAHVHREHIGPLQLQLQKHPKPFPILRINPQKRDIESFVASDFELS